MGLTAKRRIVTVFLRTLNLSHQFYVQGNCLCRRPGGRMEITMKKKENENETIIESYDYLGRAASTTDCTGLIPSAPTNRYELESYEDIYYYRPPHIAKDEGPDAVSGR